MAKQITLTLLILSLFSTAVFAKAEAKKAEVKEVEAVKPPLTHRQSYFTLGLTGGEQEYRDLSFTGGLGVNESLLLTGKLLGTKTGDDEDARVFEVRAGADYKFSREFSIRASFFGKREPSDVAASGFAAGTSYNLNSLWNGQFVTQIFADIERTRYRQESSTIRLARKNLSETFLQRAFTLGVSQEVSETFSLTVSFTKYNYSIDPGLISRALDSRLIPFPALQGLVVSFPRQISTVSADWSFADDWSTEFYISRIKNAVSSELSRAFGLGLLYRFDRSWSFGINGSTTRSETMTPFSTVGFTTSYYL